MPNLSIAHWVGIGIPISTNFGKLSANNAKSAGSLVSNSKLGIRFGSTPAKLICKNGRIICWVKVWPNCFTSDTNKSRRTSLCTLPRALVELLPSAPLVNVCPKIKRAIDFSHQSTICKNGLLPAAPPALAALCNSILIDSGIIPAALCPISANARFNVSFSPLVAPAPYLPMRIGIPYSSKNSAKSWML